MKSGQESIAHRYPDHFVPQNGAAGAHSLKENGGEAAPASLDILALLWYTKAAPARFNQGTYGSPHLPGNGSEQDTCPGAVTASVVNFTGFRASGPAPGPAQEQRCHPSLKPGSCLIEAQECGQALPVYGGESGDRHWLPASAYTAQAGACWLSSLLTISAARST